VARSRRSLQDHKLLICKNMMLEGMDRNTEQAFERSLRRLRQAGAQLVEKDLPELGELPSLMATGGFSGPESFTWHRTWLEHGRDRYDPRVALRIERGGQMKAHEYIDLMVQRAQWVQRMERALLGFDAVLSPTTPVAGIPVEQVAPGEERDAEFFRINALLLRNTSVVNTLDGCAITLPCHRAGEPPMGLMAWHAAMHDDDLLHLAKLLEPLLQDTQN
jgi:Asp-tRNA(Asn)/Glu-tRNA(Gln) amidotransferase A subunit family amidase